MWYAQGGGLTAGGRRRREQVRLAAVERFGRRVPMPEIAAELRVSERSVQRWRRAWQVIKHGLRKLQSQPALIGGCLTGTGLSLHPDHRHHEF